MIHSCGTAHYDDQMPLSVHVDLDHRVRFFSICTLAAFDGIRVLCLNFYVAIYNIAIICLRHFQHIKVFTVLVSLVTKEWRNVDQARRQMTALPALRSHVTLFHFLFDGWFHIHVLFVRWFRGPVLFAG